MIHIPIQGGYFAIVDPEDSAKVATKKWTYSQGYAVSRDNNKHIRMHRFVMNETDPNIIIDHINHNRLDNRKKNLRRVTIKENNNNKATSFLVEAWGENKTVAEWVEDSRCEVSYFVLYERIRKGVQPEAAILAPK